MVSVGYQYETMPVKDRGYIPLRHICIGISRDRKPREILMKITLRGIFYISSTIIDCCYDTPNIYLFDEEREE